MTEYYNLTTADKKEVINIPNLPKINIIKSSQFTIVPLNDFSLAMSLFLISLFLLEWLNFSSPIFSKIQIFGGICEYIFGFFNWYQGKTLFCFIDFIFGLLHLLIYYSYELSRYEIKSINKNFESYLIGAFFTIYLIILIVLFIAGNNEGILYKINMGILILADIFTLTWQFRYKKDHEYNKNIKNIIGFFLFFASFSIWYSGLGKLLNHNFKKELVPMVKSKERF